MTPYWLKDYLFVHLKLQSWIMMIYLWHRIVKMSSPNLNVLTLCGSILTYSSGFLFALEERATLQGTGSRAVLQVHMRIRFCVPLWLYPLSTKTKCDFFSSILHLSWISGPNVDAVYRQFSGVWSHTWENMAALQSVHSAHAWQETGEFLNKLVWNVLYLWQIRYCFILF